MSAPAALGRAGRRAARRGLGWLTLACVACGAPPEDEAGADASLQPAALEVIDANGTVHRFDEPPRRILSLVPAVNDLALLFGAADRLVGRTDFDDEPELADLPSVGGGLHPSLEMIVSLRPDLVIRFHGPTDVETPARLDELDIPHFAVHPETIDGVRTTVENVSDLLDRAAEGDAFVEGLDRTLAEIRGTVADAARPRTAFLTAGDPPWVAGPGTYVGELLEVAGAENAYADLVQPWSAVSPETLVGRSIDVLLVADDATVDPRIAKVVPIRRVTAEVLLPGAGIVEAAREIAAALHPELFPEW